jgi:hypothetical protein
MTPMSLPPDAHLPGHEESTADEPRGDGLDELLRPRLSQRAQLLRAGLLVALIVVAAGGLLWRVAGFGQLAPSAPLATPPLSLAPPGVRILSNVGFGSVSVNGQSLGTLPAVAELGPGQNTITLDAPPFRSHTCTITWPFGGADDLACVVSTLSDPQPVTARGQRIILGGELDIQMVGADLDADQCARVLDLVGHALDATVLTTTVPAGQHIAARGESPEGIPASRIAPADLQARLTVQAQVFAGRPCTSLRYGGIAQPYYAVPPPRRSWSANVPVLEQMTFVQADGLVIGQTSTMEGTAAVMLEVPDNGKAEWRLVTTDPPLSTQLTGNLCDRGVQTLSKAFSLTHPTESWGIGSTSDGGLEGCQLDLDTIDGGVETDTHYLWRFGVLLAEDAAAHKVLPQLPIASSGDLAEWRAGS